VGFSGDPAALVTFSGGADRKNSQRPSVAQAAAMSSSPPHLAERETEIADEPDVQGKEPITGLFGGLDLGGDVVQGDRRELLLVDRASPPTVADSEVLMRPPRTSGW
jgi:hypothetical protein